MSIIVTQQWGYKMKALSIKQPHIHRILEGLKIYEIRSWKTSYRGEILLCASKQTAKGCEEGMITGHALGIADIIDIVPYEPHMSDKAMADYTPGQYAWVLGSVKKIKPFPIVGQLGLFEVTVSDQI